MTPQELTQKIAQRLEQWQKAQENQMSGYDRVGGPLNAVNLSIK